MKPIYQKRLLKISILLGMVSIGVWLILKTFNENVMFFYTPTDLLDQHITDTTKTMRVGGFVKNGSIKQSDQTLDMEFVITDFTNEMTVKYTGLVPNLFKDGQGAIAKGNLESQTVFIATEILAKHDENYVPKEIVDRLKEKNLWKDANSVETR